MYVHARACVCLEMDVLLDLGYLTSQLHKREWEERGRLGGLATPAAATGG